MNSVCINHLNFYETSHFSERVGDLIIDRIYNRKNPDLPKDFGIQVNNKNALQQIEQHKAWIDDYFGSISFDQSSWVKLSRVPAQPKTLTGEEALIRIDELVRSANENIFHILSSPYLRLTVRKPLNFNQIPVVFLDQQLLYYRSVNENIGHSFNPVRIIKSGEWELLVPAQRLDTGFHSLSVGYLDTVTGRWSKSPGVFRIRVLHERDYPEGSTISESQSTGSTEKIYFELFSVNGKPGNADQYIVTEPWLNLNGWAVDAHTKLPVDNLVALVNDNPIPILFKQEQTFLAVMFDNAKSKFAGWTTLLPLPKAGNEARIEFARLTDDRKSIIKIGRGFSVSRQLPNDTTLLTGLKKLEFSTQYWIDKINNEKALSKSKHQIGAGSLKISGWAVDHSAGKPAGKVYVKLGNKLFGARYSDPREDVAEHYKNPNYANCGWTAEISTAQIAKGTHLVRLVIVTHDGTSYYLVDQGAKVVIL